MQPAHLKKQYAPTQDLEYVKVTAYNISLLQQQFSQPFF